MINLSILSSQACYCCVNKSDVYVHVAAEKCVDKKNKNIFKKYLLNRFYSIY